MCAPFALWEGFKTSCEPETVENRRLLALQRALATAAVKARHVARTNQHNGRKKWHSVTLSFSDASLEQAFRFYYADLRSPRMRTGMLTFCSLYIVYAMIVWSSDALKDELYLRTGYLCFLLFAFVASFSSTWSNWSQLGSFVVATATLIEVVGEAVILNHLLGPSTLIILILFMLAWNVFVRFRFLYTVILCTVTGAVYFCIAIIYFRGGDSSVPANQVTGSLAWNMSVLLLASIFVSKMSHRQEVSSRYNFLSNMHRASTAMFGRSSSNSSSRPGSPTFVSDVHRPHEHHGHLHERCNKDAEDAGGDGGADHFNPTSGDDDDGRRLSKRASSSDSPKKIVKSARKHLAGSPMLRPKQNPLLLPSDLPTIMSGESKEGESFSSSSSSSHMRKEGEEGLMGPLMSSLARTASRMAVEASQNMSRIGHFTDAPLYGTGEESVASYFFGDVGLFKTMENSNGVVGGDAVAATAAMTAPLLGNHERVASQVQPYSSQHLPDEQQDQQAIALEEEMGRGEEGAAVLLSQPCLVNHDQLPAWFEAYSYTYTGYRVHYNDRLSLNSILQCHNETSNIWTEFLPLMFFSVFIIWMLEDWSVVVHAPSLDRGFMIIGLLGCLILRPFVSGMAHTFFQQSQRNYIVWWAADYVSICVAITCSSLIFARFTFYCECDRQLFYIIGVLGLLTSTIIAVVSVASAGVRVTSFILLVVIANGLPLLLQLYLQFTSNEIYNVLPWEFMAAWMASLGVMIFGLIVRGCSIPEVCCPGCFDYIGHSHGYWHLCINGGFSVMLVGIQKYLAFRSVHVCPENKIDWCNNATWISVNGTTGNMTHAYF